MTSPYLDHSRHTRKLIEELIAARKAELAKTTAAAERQRLDRDLAFCATSWPGSTVRGSSG